MNNLELAEFGNRMANISVVQRTIITFLSKGSFTGNLTQLALKMGYGYCNSQFNVYLKQLIEHEIVISEDYDFKKNELKLDKPNVYFKTFSLSENWINCIFAWEGIDSYSNMSADTEMQKWNKRKGRKR